MAIEKQKGTEGLILGGGGDVLCDGQMSQKSRNLGASHFFRMLFVVKQNVATRPGNIAFLRPVGVMCDSNGFSDLVEPFLGSWLWG
jgi:hypothetical protein